MQELFTGGKGQAVLFQFVFVQGVEAYAAKVADMVLLVPIHGIEEEAHHAGRMARGQQTLDGGIAQCDFVAVFQLNIGRKERSVGVGAGFQIDQLRAVPHNVRTRFAYDQLAAVQVLEFVCRTDVIEMLVGVYQILDVRRIKSQLPDGLHHQVDAVLKAAVEHDEAVSRVDKVGADLLVTNVIEIFHDFERFDVVPRGVAVIV